MLLPPLVPQPEVGFVWHFPFVDVGTRDIPKSGADAMIARAAWRALEPEEGRYDWANLDRQLAEARAGGFRLVLLLECNAFCAPKWAADKASAAGEGARDAGGNEKGLGPVGGIPQADSPTFDRVQSAFLRRLTDYIEKADPQHTITTYQPGIEWWFPYSWRYAPADVDRFRAWLGRRYGNVAALNKAWSTQYAGFGDAEAPRYDVRDLYLKGRRGLAPMAPVGDKPAFGNWAAASYDFGRFWEDVAARTINRLAAKVKALDPSRPTMSWVTNSYAIGSEWDYVQWSSVSLDVVARAASGVDVLGMQIVSSYGDPYRISFGLDLARKYGKPMAVLDLLDFSLGVATGVPSMMRATHTAIAHGGASLWYCNWNGAKDFNFYPDWKMGDLRAMVDEAKASLAFVRGAKVRARGAIVNPYLPTVGASWIDAQTSHSLMGWYRILERAGETVDVLTPRDLAADPKALSKYAFVVLPDAPVMDAAAARALATYARSGRLILGCRPPARDPANRPLAFAGGDARLPDLGKALVGDPIRDNSAGDTPPMFVLPEGGEAAASALRKALTRLGAPASQFALRGGAGVARTDFSFAGGIGVYLVADGKKPVDDARLSVGAGSRVRALVDGVARDLSVEGGTVRVPSFSRAAIVKVARKANPV